MSAEYTLANLIDGKLKPPSTGNYIPSLNPATGKTLCLVPDSSKDDVDDAVKAAKKAFSVSHFFHSLFFLSLLSLSLCFSLSLRSLSLLSLLSLLLLSM
jgi:hypothetical protein